MSFGDKMGDALKPAVTVLALAAAGAIIYYVLPAPAQEWIWSRAKELLPFLK